MFPTIDPGIYDLSVVNSTANGVISGSKLKLNPPPYYVFQNLATENPHLLSVNFTSNISMKLRAFGFDQIGNKGCLLLGQVIRKNTKAGEDDADTFAAVRVNPG
jgi:hypothetical protein